MPARLLTLGVAAVLLLFPVAADAMTPDAPGGGLDTPSPSGSGYSASDVGRGASASDLGGRVASASDLGGRVASASERIETRIETRPLAGRTIVLDPGHQLGNAEHL